MKKPVLFVHFLIIFTAVSPAFAADFQQTTLSYEVCFTPGGDCTNDIVNAINTAKKQILVQAYQLTSAPIAWALVQAHRRGVEVKVILDKSQDKKRRWENYSPAKFLTNQGISTWIDYKPAIAHNKVMVIDNNEVITGSFNFTKAAQYRNAENLLILKDANLARAYADNWNKRKLQSESIKNLAN